ncbi:hypothetical protein [Mycobacterium shigaense]|uniref:hypothetical protein n=1 Tax=Mycobacterium shigaense TaxID=722731 RepID=UPI002AE08862|nr:hypothetical protein [Mycobacterium shigaense]MEA1122192.1 hypothetical protein [Mycobacterium shigaense]
MNARSKQVFAIAGSAFVVASLLTGCAFEAVPGVIGTGAGTAPAGSVPAAAAAAAGAAAAK